MLGQVVYQLKKILLDGNGDRNDDYNWDLYHHHYHGELEDSKKEFTAKISEGDYVYRKGYLTKTDKAALPLHPNHRLVYETILQLRPATVLEVGCGWGDHLHNLNILNPKLKLYGNDISKQQLRNLHQRYPTLPAEVSQFDITLPFSDYLPKVDLCFTQAVVMHLKTGSSHLVALANMFKTSKNYVVLMENWSNHNFLADIKLLYQSKMIAWEKMYIYYRRSPELGNIGHLMVISSHKLKYTPLLRYDALKNEK
ncbi:class I SAM-dependent methyltransferase [Patescibacteria group bacterium]|nr:class I SAM-dependent methyltransferase [Patescibacteria group bacterium]MCL5409264.1 class I SAM-dependent methyltransferase [Patescibacteria group bacterium]